MAQLPITIADDKLTEMRAAYAWKHNYQPRVPAPGGEWTDNPESRAQFALRMIRESIRQTMREHHRFQGEATARQAADTYADGIALT